MKINQIRQLIKNESRDVQDMVIASLDGQVDVRFRQIVDDEIQKLGVIFDGDHIADYGILKILSDENIHDLGLDKHPELMLYRDLILLIENVRLDRDEIFYECEYVGLEADLRRDASRSQPVRDLFQKIMGQVYESEYIDITESTFLNLKSNRKLVLKSFSY